MNEAIVSTLLRDPALAAQRVGLGQAGVGGDAGAAEGADLAAFASMRTHYEAVRLQP